MDKKCVDIPVEMFDDTVFAICPQKYFLWCVASTMATATATMSMSKLLKGVKK